MRWAIAIFAITEAASAFVSLRLRYWQRQVRKAEARRDVLDAELARYR